MSVIIPVILCGGSGTRLWPLSRRARPKQFVALVDPDRTMLQATRDRVPAYVPAERIYDGIRYHRPLLGLPAAAIRGWLAARGVAFVEDPTNTDQGFTRNRIRAQLLPALEQVFPQFRDTFARSARHAAQAQQLLDDVAGEDLQQLASGGGLSIDRARLLSHARLANLLRHWLRVAHATVPSAAQLDELLSQLADCRTRGHRIHIKVGRGFVRRVGKDLTWYNPPADPTSTG